MQVQVLLSAPNLIPSIETLGFDIGGIFLLQTQIMLLLAMKLQDFLQCQRKMNMEIIYTDGNDERFISLCRQLDDYLNILVGGAKQRDQYAAYNTLEDIHDVVLIVEDDTVAACGSFKDYESGAAEVKRVFTAEDFRNRGFGRAVMKALEERARSKGYKRLVLETGTLLHAAMKMYGDIGFHVIENYGQYADMSESVCMEKWLEANK